MSVTQRTGEWTLDEKEPGVYLVKRRGHLQAKVVTDDCEPSETVEYLLEGGVADVIEVETAADAYERFRTLVAERAR
ncbi:hypothetical protein EFA46_006235 [Halarchaeum sp. CBA1220]|uniref:hypothetical protein n=1 Tax=Halarchaeum sp. CBA1220 TaxID=1853682 RepID=UPI0011CE6430|nr:hypothetical protein [Halarchaeum sp. CBA1220]QLC33812.1 hypothetical protein EFA46_006235 [Halarchaeum sp. CBA1220]